METWSSDAPLDMLREELLAKMVEATGKNRPEYAAVLKILAHPDMIKTTLAYLKPMDFEARCREYVSPWSCIKEAEAKYDNLKHGGLAGPSFLDHGFGEWWCETCRQKVLED